MLGAKRGSVGGVARRVRGQRSTLALGSAGKKFQAWRLAGLVLRVDGGHNDYYQKRRLVHRDTSANRARHV